LIKAYWVVFALVLVVFASVLYPRGVETSLKQRWRKMRSVTSMKSLRLIFVLGVMLFVLGGFALYDTHVLNSYHSSGAKMVFRANYERELKSFEDVLQPEIVHMDIQLDLYPRAHNYKLSGEYILKNSTDIKLDAVHVQTYVSAQENLGKLKLEGESILDSSYVDFGYLIFFLKKPLLPGDSIRLSFTQNSNCQGFSEVHTTQVLTNGTYINTDRFPSLGYNPIYELSDKVMRDDLGLLEKSGYPDREHEFGSMHRSSNYDGLQTSMNIIVSTDAHQEVICLGSLIDQWSENDRAYFHYQQSKSTISFFPISSGTFETLKDTIVLSEGKKVRLEIHHHPDHDRNIGNMMTGMKASLSYCSREFGEYQFDDLRIVEHPRFDDVAQSYPSVISISEDMGFLLDLEGEHVDVPFFIVAHEVAHQWWGIRLAAARVKGQKLLIESLAHYSAFMVMKEIYGDSIAQELLQIEKERYLSAKGDLGYKDTALINVEDEEYLYYSKAAYVLYELQECIGEQTLNRALREFFSDWNLDKKVERLPTSADLMRYLREVADDTALVDLG